MASDLGFWPIRLPWHFFAPAPDHPCERIRLDSYLEGGPHRNCGWLSELQVGHLLIVSNGRAADLIALGLITITWAGAVAAGLWITRSSLPGDLRRRKPTAYPRVAEVQAAETSAGSNRESGLSFRPSALSYTIDSRPLWPEQ